MSFAGAILDVDGVLVDSPHERAWRDTLRELMDGEWRDIRRRTSYAPERFTHEVYQHEVAGKPRMSGARAALEHFGVPDVEEMAGPYADRKQQRIVELIAAGEFTAFPDPALTQSGSCHQSPLLAWRAKSRLLLPPSL